MNNLDKLHKLTEYHNFLKKSSSIDVTVLEHIMHELRELIEEENAVHEKSFQKVINYINDNLLK